MALPTLEQYNEAAQNPASSFFDPELQRGRVKTSGLGIPLAACGGFALTYTITNGRNKYAVRCFHKDARDREIRYDAISRKLSALNSGYFVGFQFQKKGIKVKGQPWPIVKMAWAKGETIGEFVDANFRNRDAMLALKQSVLDLASFLEKNRISHGDIQPGNLMVSSGGQNIQLIDYDGMYLPEISTLTSEETGHRNFQHPDRVRLNPWNERSDRFSFILLSIAFDALSYDPELWIRSRSDGDKFLLGANDFVAPASSKIFSEISAIPALKDRLTRFSSICLGGYDAIPSLTDYINLSFQISVSSAIPSRKVGYISTYPVLDAKDYDLCLKHVGDMVELVGKVVNVRFSITKWGKPYCFLNFADWRGKAVKISIWSNYLDKAKGIDFKRLKGKFISVIGLMQPPYHGKSKYHEYTHLSISLDTTVNEIEEQEARYRLNYEKGVIPERELFKENVRNRKRSNRDILDDIKGEGRTAAASSVQSPPSRNSGQRKSNRDIFNDIRSTASSGRQSTGIHTAQGQSKSSSSLSSSKKDFFVPCPRCTTRNRIGTSGVETVACSSCQAVFEYSHYTQKTRLTSCPTPGSVYPETDTWIRCPYCQTPTNVGRTGIEWKRCSVCKGEFQYSHYTKSIIETKEPISKPTNAELGQSMKTDSPPTSSHQNYNNDFSWAGVLIGCALLVFLLVVLNMMRV